MTSSRSIVLAALLVVCLILPVRSEDEAPKKPLPKPPTTKKDEPKAPEITWTKLKSETGKLKKPENKAGAQQPKPVKIEFDTNAPGIRVSWKTETLEGARGGSMSMVLYQETKRGERTSSRRVANLGNIRGATEDARVLGLTGGSYYVEITGQDLSFEITIEAGERSDAPSAPDKK